VTSRLTEAYGAIARLAAFDLEARRAAGKSKPDGPVFHVSFLVTKALKWVLEYKVRPLYAPLRDDLDQLLDLIPFQALKKALHRPFLADLIRVERALKEEGLPLRHALSTRVQPPH
jgi:hypothetical protein